MLKNKETILLNVFLLVLGFTAPLFGQEEFIYDSGGKRDPFIPIVTANGVYRNLEPQEAKEDAGLKLEGIIYDKYGISYAIVNGLVVKTGDTADDYQVLKIEEKKVVFIKEGEIKEIDLKKE